MRIAMRWLVIACLPMVAAGGVVTVTASPAAAPVDPWRGVLLFVAAGTAVLFVRSVAVVIGDLERGAGVTSHPWASTLIALSGIGATSSLGLPASDFPAGDLALVWMQAAVVTVAATALAIVAAMLVRALIGLWGRPELRLWPGRGLVCLALIGSALAAAPVPVPHSAFEPAMVIPAAESVWLGPLQTDDRPPWVYLDYGTGLL